MTHKFEPCKRGIYQETVSVDGEIVSQQMIEKEDEPMYPIAICFNCDQVLTKNVSHNCIRGIADKLDDIATLIDSRMEALKEVLEKLK